MNTLLSTAFVLAEAEMEPRLFNLDMQLISDACLSIIAVITLFFFVGYFLFNPARKVLNDRKERIKNDIDSAVRDKEEALALKKEYEEKLKNIDSEAEEILSEARKKARANEAKIVADANADAARIVDRAKVEAELERKKVNDDVKREIVSVASLMAGKIVAASIDAQVSDDLIDETLKEMGENTWLS